MKTFNKLPRWVRMRIGQFHHWELLPHHGYLQLSRSCPELKRKKITAYMVPELLSCLELMTYEIDILELDRNNLKSQGAIILFNGLKKSMSTIRAVYLCNNQLDDTCMTSLGEYIQSNQSLYEIWLRQSEITDAGIEILTPYILGNTSLKEIWFDDCSQITNASVPNFMEMAKKSELEEIWLFRTDVDHHLAYEICELLNIPSDQREIPLKSNTKSAAKTQ